MLTIIVRPAINEVAASKCIDDFVVSFAAIEQVFVIVFVGGVEAVVSRSAVEDIGAGSCKQPVVSRPPVELVVAAGDRRHDPVFERSFRVVARSELHFVPVEAALAMIDFFELDREHRRRREGRMKIHVRSHRPARRTDDRIKLTQWRRNEYQAGITQQNIVTFPAGNKIVALANQSNQRQPKGSETFQFCAFGISCFPFHSESEVFLSSNWRRLILWRAFRPPTFAGIESDARRSAHQLGKAVAPNGHAKL